jgi:three-Cys-motif partner protein
MSARREVPSIDEIGPWTDVKLDILKRYAAEYSKIMAAQQNPAFHHVYIDAFAGAGFHFSKTLRSMVRGSPLNALLVKPPFREFFLIDLLGDRIEGLRKIIGKRADVHLYPGDCNEILPAEVFPKVRFGDYKRGLLILDPYKMNLQWTIIQEAGQMRSLDVFINFPIMDINRNVLRHDPTSVDPADVACMNALWGDESWRDITYSQAPNLFGDVEIEKSATNETVAEAFRQRLVRIAGFKRVPKPLAMRNKKNATVYYLFFASQKGTAEDIAKWIFHKYALGGTRDVGQFKNRMD